jgi:hypothetical protein
MIKNETLIAGLNAKKLKETMSTTMHLFTFYLESDGMSTNNDYKHFFGALSLQFC